MRDGYFRSLTQVGMGRVPVDRMMPRSQLYNSIDYFFQIEKDKKKIGQE